ncbi:TPA: lytic murein transglycosylase [Mannheimia haemolytica]
MEKNRLLNTVKYSLSVIFLTGSIASKAEPFFGFGKEVDGYIRIAAQRYQISEPMLRGLIKMEDGWYGNISPTGATGVGQFTVGAWNWLADTYRGREIGMRLVTRNNRGTSFDPRHNKYINTLATALLARWHIEQFSERNIPVNDENLYMAHNIGLDGFHRALLGQSTRKDIENMRKNGMKPWMTVNEFISYQKGRYTEHKYVANFQLPPNRLAESVSSGAIVSETKPKKNIRLVLPAKIRYIEPNDELAMQKQGHSSSKVNWIEPSSGNTVWISPK